LFGKTFIDKSNNTRRVSSLNKTIQTYINLPKNTGLYIGNKHNNINNNINKTSIKG
jgi:hypothetical protein